MVYIKEAHAIDSRMPGRGGRGPIIEDPITTVERQKVAQTCVVKLDLEMIPAVLDRIDNKVNDAYQGWPDRLFLVGRDGKMAFSGGRGPGGFITSQLADAIKKELGKTKEASTKRKL